MWDVGHVINKVLLPPSTGDRTLGFLTLSYIPTLLAFFEMGSP